MEEVIKKWSTGKAKALYELIASTKERDFCQIEICDMEKTVLNQKQAISHSSKEHKNFASNVKFEADTTQEEKTRLLYYVKII